MATDKLHTNIVNFRKSLGMSQASTAEALGIGRTTYINFEKGRTKLFCNTLIRFASYAGVDPTDILLPGFENDENLLCEKGNFEEKRKALILEYEERLEDLNHKLEEAQKTINYDQTLIKNLTSTNNYLLSRLNKED